MVMLDKVSVNAGKLLPDPFVEALKKESSIIAKDLWFKDQDTGQAGCKAVHGSFFLLCASLFVLADNR